MKCGCAGLSTDSLVTRLNNGENDQGKETTEGGSLFLDEISHLDPASQARLLNLLPDGNGNPSAGCLSVRIICSTTRNLEDEMRNGRFREELYYRINGVHLRLPPLRNRKEDIPALLDFFLKKYASLFGRPEPHLARQRWICCCGTPGRETSGNWKMSREKWWRWEMNSLPITILHAEMRRRVPSPPRLPRAPRGTTDSRPFA